MQEQIRKDGTGLKKLENFILEIVLLVYPLLLISGGLTISPHYLIIVLAILVGTGAYVLYLKEANSVVVNLFMSLLMALPFYFIGLPGTAVILIFIYVFWRMDANFGLIQGTNWNFLAVNTIVFAGFYFFTFIYILKPLAAERNDVNITLFLVTTVLFIVLGYVRTILTGKHSSTFKLRQANKVFAAVLGVGLLAYLVVYYFIACIPRAIMAIYTYLSINIFKRISPETIPTINENELPKSDEAEVDLEVVLDPLKDEADLGIYVFIVVAIFAVILLFRILRQRRRKFVPTELPTHKIRSFGRRKKQETPKQGYDYSMAINTVRIAYQEFEKDECVAKYPILEGETVKERFARMGWGQSDNLFMTYDKARYGALSITEEESRSFVHALEKIKKEIFIKDV